jgi:methylmalonyl-CoA/ethylmalonyl-CoA epimerase
LLPQLTRIDHVGIACRDLERAIELYRDAFGLRVVGVETNEPQGVREAMLAVAPDDLESGAGGLNGLGGLGFGVGGYVQLLEPLAPDTPVGKFLARRGEGIHHIGYGVTDITKAMAAISEAGIRLIDERPRHGSLGASIAFLHPADLGGVLTELVQFTSAPGIPESGCYEDLAGCIGWRTTEGPANGSTEE